MAKIQYSALFSKWLRDYGKVFTTFTEHDSGNISYGIETSARQRHFVKFTPLENKFGIKLLQNAYALGMIITHNTLPNLHHLIECLDGKAIVYDWVDAETMNEVTMTNKDISGQLRQNQMSAYSRIKALSVDKIVSILNQIFELHILLEKEDYVSVDWYDGNIMYNFEKDTLYIMDLDHYHKGPFTNNMGRMYGSSRFMAPEEYVKGALIDHHTTVYHLGATVFEILGTGKKTPSAGFRGNDHLSKVALRAIDENKACRYQTVKEFCDDWNKALGYCF